MVVKSRRRYNLCTGLTPTSLTSSTNICSALHTPHMSAPSGPANPKPTFMCWFCGKFIIDCVIVDHYYNCRDKAEGKKPPKLTESEQKELLARKFHLNRD